MYFLQSLFQYILLVIMLVFITLVITLVFITISLSVLYCFFVFFVMAYTKQNAFSRFVFHPLYILSFSKIREFTEETVCTTSFWSRAVPFKQRATGKFGYDKTAVFRIFLLFQCYRLLFIKLIVIKKLPEMGS